MKFFFRLLLIVVTVSVVGVSSPLRANPTPYYGNAVWYGAVPHPPTSLYGRPGSPLGFGNPGAGVNGYDYGGLFYTHGISVFGLPSPSGVFGPYAPGYAGYDYGYGYGSGATYAPGSFRAFYSLPY